MKTQLLTILSILLFGLVACEKESPVSTYLNTIETHTYYSAEIIPAQYQLMYGKWHLDKISGGIMGSGYQPDYEYLEIKSFGIYGLVRNDSLIEYGKIELNTFDTTATAYLQVKLIPTYYTGPNPGMNPPEKYINLKAIDTMELLSPCCDMYNYHYSRSR